MGCWRWLLGMETPLGPHTLNFFKKILSKTRFNFFFMSVAILFLSIYHYVESLCINYIK